jgi:hypothetical protein
MITGSDVARLALAAASTVLVVYRLVPRVQRDRSRGAAWTTVLQGPAWLAGMAAALWIAACLVLDAPWSLVWPGVLVGGFSSSAYLVTYVVSRVRQRTSNGTRTVESPEATTSTRNAIPDGRLVASMMLVLGASSSLAALRLNVWWLVASFGLLFVAGWVALVVMQFRR